MKNSEEEEEEEATRRKKVGEDNEGLEEKKIAVPTTTGSVKKWDTVKTGAVITR